MCWDPVHISRIPEAIPADAVVGYHRLVSLNEAGTLRAFRLL